LKENSLFTFQEELLLTRKENQIENNQTITTQPILSTKVKTKIKPMSSSMQMKNVLSNHQANEKHKALNSQPITGS
jgi:hypothetical protein